MSIKAKLVIDVVPVDGRGATTRALNQGCYQTKLGECVSPKAFEYEPGDQEEEDTIEEVEHEKPNVAYHKA